MASISYSPKEIFEQEFKIGMRGYDRKEVDEFLDEVIKDYETFEAQIQALREENEALKSELQKAKAAQSVQAAKPSQPVNPVYATNPTATVTTPTYAGPSPVAQPSASQTSPQAATNFDILKRISRLELEVFGKQITE